MTVGMPVSLRNARLDAITTAAGGNALLRIYDGSRPATGGAATTLLAELTCNATFAPAASAGTLTLNPITADPSANATGTATWARIVKSDGTTFVLDCSVGTSGQDINLSTVSIVAAASVTVTSAVFTEGNA
jgi:hypothetical protein